MIKLDILDRIALAFFSLWIMFTITNAYSATWNEKPVLCEQLEVAMKILKSKGETPIANGIQHAKVRDDDGLSDIPAHIPIQIFVNWKTKSFTILEFHPSYNSVCVIAFGDDYKQLGISG